jgi:hypothetical protein
MSTEDFPYEQPQPSSTGWMTYIDHEVIDETGERIGTVTDVLYEDPPPSAIGTDATPTPTWLVVDPGFLRAAHYVPVAGSYRTETGAVVVPWHKDWISNSVKAKGDHLLTAEERNLLAQHYAMVD